MVFQQGADHADGKTIAGADGVDHGGYWHAGDKALIHVRAVISTMGPELDRHRFSALVEVKRGDVGRVLETGQQATLAQPRQDPVGEGGEAVDFGDHLLFAGPQAGAQVGVERHAAPGLAHARHQLERHLPRTVRQRRHNAGGVQVPCAEQLGNDRLRCQKTGRRTTAEVLDPWIVAVVGARLELETGRVVAVDGDVAAIQAFLLQRVDHESTEGIPTNPAQPRHLEAQSRQTDGDVAVRPGDAFVKMIDAGQVTVVIGDEHGHGFAKRKDIDLRHGRAPGGFVPGCSGR